MGTGLLDRYTPDQIDQALREATGPEAAAIVAALEREVFLWYCDRPDCDGQPHEGAQLLHARAAQHPPDGDWLTWFQLAGRGWGKTRSGAEFVKDGYEQSLLRLPGARWALVGETFADGRDTMVEGVSGLLSILPPSALRDGSVSRSWNRSLGELILANGSRAKLFTAEKPGQLRGPAHHGAWGDEPAKWQDAPDGDIEDTTWSNLLLGLREGADPRVVLTGTPKRVKLLVGTKAKPGLLKERTTVVTKGTTYENLSNLAETFRQNVVARYEGGRLGRQELNAELLEDVPGALWAMGMIEAKRVRTMPHDLARVVTAIDPAATSTEDADDTGIIIAGKTIRSYCPACGPTDGRPHAFVMADWTCHLPPHGWASRGLAGHDRFQGDAIVGEVNNGGEMVEHTIRSVRQSAPYKAVHASRGKRTRAEPVAAMYGDPTEPETWEKGRVHHVEIGPEPVLAELEEQLTTWVPDSGMDSPDRLDALVWALTELMIEDSGGVIETQDRRHAGRR